MPRYNDKLRKPRRGSSRNNTALVLAVIAIPVLAVLALIQVWSSASGTQPTPAAFNSPTAVVALAPSVSPSATRPPSPTATSMPTATPTVEPSPTPTNTPEPTATPTVTATAELTPSTTATAEPSATPQPTDTTVPATTSNGQRLIAIDPGHGGQYTGAVHYDASGNADVIESHVNLRVALLLGEMLSANGYNIMYTRSADTMVNTAGADTNGDGQVTTEDDLQARVDAINASGADLLFSIHHNGSEPSMRGTMTFYCANRPFAERNRVLADLLHSSTLHRLAEVGYNSPDLGVRDDATLNKPGGHLCLVGPQTEYLARASQMPGALGEALFVSNDQEAALLKDEGVLRAIATGYFDAVQRYYEQYPQGLLSGSP